MQEPRRYRSDDRDLERCDNDLVVFQGDNGDWYISIVKHGEKLGPSVRITTSGTPRGYEQVPVAVHGLYKALGGETRQQDAASDELRFESDLLCDCEQPDDKGGIALVSNTCPIHGDW